ncbi:MAG TPA: YicC family protein [Candidatus Coprenecus stercoravium]|uniref:YicC family protein n=1 Tax=Candidatus Coprenecus stercoravium TaxID=2840735 RepID=A0A9D2GQ80_9BACT|nr:YicC family protein [Candidatus Coprenecus stercoravium]
MVVSMTGYGKAEVTSGNRKYTVEVRSLNGKNCDISLKSSLLPKDKDLEFRQYLTHHLVRGNIDVFLTSENVSGSEARRIDPELFRDYFRQLSGICESLNLDPHQDFMASILSSSVLRLPDVVAADKNELNEEDLEAISGAMHKAVDALTAFRIKEGAVLRNDLQTRVDNILSILSEAEAYEAERVPAIRQRITARMEELALEPDHDRLEQEMIFYLEKLDVNEEKVRLRQHCRYFTDTMDAEECPGRKLGFIAQEMGREINTLGSKSNHAGMQKCVVRMKDELEKIKEQVLNVL